MLNSKYTLLLSSKDEIKENRIYEKAKYKNFSGNSWLENLITLQNTKLSKSCWNNFYRYALFDMELQK